jgi:toxin YoeB
MRRINELIKDIGRNGNEGIGKPEPLKPGLPGLLVTPHHRRTPIGLQDRR